MRILLILSALLISGCAMAMGRHEWLETSRIINPITVSPWHVKLYERGAVPKVPCVRVASLRAGGNGYARTETLHETLKEEAAKVGADAVLVTDRGVSYGGSVGSYGAGIAISQPLGWPWMTGVACRSAQVDLGFRYDHEKDGLIEYVFKDSPASKAGIVEGDRLLGVNHQPIKGDPFLFEQEVLSKSPGDRVTIEILTKDGVKVSKEMILEGVRAK